ncbi:hypothetical protein [Paenibacillus sp. FSL L8-0494]|uniref:hypothetical protein n=1 Tax=Paenibacillus sp. FSL L8-0494 TaxID=2975352 RepID=UPI0030F5CFE9
MFFFKKNKGITKEELQALVEGLEQAYMDKDEEGLSKRFHPDKRGMSFLNHFQLMMTFQIYNIKSEILEFELLSMDATKAVFTYTRKHIHTCINPADEREEKRNQIISYYVEAVKENGSIWITRYSPYSTIFVDKKGDFLSGVDAVIPPGEEINSGIVRFIPYFQLNSYVPATFHVYSNSQFIGYYPLGEYHRYEPSHTFTINYFDKIEASSVEKHTADYISQETLLTAQVLHQTDNSSVVETQLMNNNVLEHELVTSLLTKDGFYMIRFLYDKGEPIPAQEREKWKREMVTLVEKEHSS